VKIALAFGRGLATLPCLALVRRRETVHPEITMSLDYATDVSAYAIAAADQQGHFAVASRPIHTVQDHACNIFTAAGLRLELCPIAIFSLWQATWTDGEGKLLGKVIGPSADRAASAAVAKLTASSADEPAQPDVVVLAR
jgi:hypothetical protein